MVDKHISRSAFRFLMKKVDLLKYMYIVPLWRPSGWCNCCSNQYVFFDRWRWVSMVRAISCFENMCCSTIYSHIADVDVEQGATFPKNILSKSSTWIKILLSLSILSNLQFLGCGCPSVEKEEEVQSAPPILLLEIKVSVALFKENIPFWMFLSENSFLTPLIHKKIRFSPETMHTQDLYRRLFEFKTMYGIRNIHKWWKYDVQKVYSDQTLSFRISPTIKETEKLRSSGKERALLLIPRKVIHGTGSGSESATPSLSSPSLCRGCMARRPHSLFFGRVGVSAWS